VRIVQLYFVHGWSVRRIGDRYNLRKDTVHTLLAQWRIRAIESGYIQEIEPDTLAAIVPEAQHTGDTGYVPKLIFHTLARPRKIVYTTAAPALTPPPEGQPSLSAGRSA